MRIFRWIHAKLLKVSAAIGKVSTFLLLLISFYVVLLPLSLLRRVVGRRPENAGRGGWLPREPLPRDHFHRQY